MTPPGEIWEWALGRNAFNDPDLARYTGGVGRQAGVPLGDNVIGIYTADEAVNLAGGFKLIPWADSTIGSVELYNSDGQFQAYPGRLPVGLSWDMTGADIEAVYDGAFQFVPFSGSVMPITFKGMSDDGRLAIEIDFGTFIPAQTPGGRLHRIAVSRGPNWTPDSPG
jgi:hypothetical protein